MTFEILNPDDPAWDALFARLPLEQQDVFYGSGFARICQGTLYPDYAVCCAAMTSREDVALYPLVRRNLSRVTGMPQLVELTDTTSLYGRGGVVSSSRDAGWLQSFHRALGQYCRDMRIICGFDRFHPVIANDSCADPGAKVMDIGGFVVVDLRPPMEQIEASFKPSVRKDIRKGERNGVSCFVESDVTHIAEFLNIYYHTMNRNAATGFYYFPEDYFRCLPRDLSGQFHFFYASCEGRVVSCELVLHHGRYCHSFLGGTRAEALPLSANPVLKREIIKVMKQRGCELFLLGGGTHADDGIFNFKRAYAPEGVYPSRIGGMVWDRAAYDSVRDQLLAAGQAVAPNRFQFYDRG